MAASAVEMQLQSDIRKVEIDKISVNPFQPRKKFCPEELEELAKSIEAVGLIHPPVVREIEGEGRFELIAGERRTRACQLLGWKHLMVVIHNSSASQSAQAALIENVQRIDLNPLEVSASLKRLIDEFNFTQEQLAERVGKKRSTVANYLRLHSLPQNIRDSISSGLISMGHAKVLLSVEGADRRQLLHELVLRDDLTVRQAEDKAKKFSKKKRAPQPVYRTRDFYLEQLEETMARTLGTKVFIQPTGKGRQKSHKGRVSIDYYSLDDLERLLALLGVQELDN